jgi:hypothetical protein
MESGRSGLDLKGVLTLNLSVYIYVYVRIYMHKLFVSRCSQEVGVSSTEW